MLKTGIYLQRKKQDIVPRYPKRRLFCKKMLFFCILSDFRKFCPIIHCVYEKNNVPLHRFLNREGFVMINQERNEMKNSLRHILCTGILLLSFGMRAATIDSLLANFDNRPTLANADAFFGYLYEQEFTDEPRMYSNVPTPPMDTVKALVWYWAGEWYYATQQYPLAEKNLLRALELMQYADKVSYSDNLAMLGLVEMRQSKYEDALHYMHRCYELDLESGDAERICSSLNTIAGTLMAAGNASEGKKYVLRAIEYAKKAGNPARLAVVYGMASEIEHSLNDDPKALCYIDSACVMEATTGNTRKMMVRKSQKASILTGLGRYEESSELLDEVIPFFRESCDQMSLAISLNKRALTRHGLNRSEEALTDLYEAIDICRRIGNPVNEAYAQREVDEILFKTKPEEARQHLERYHELKDSLYSKSTAEQIARFEAEFKLGEFEQENSRLKRKDKIYAIMAVIIILLLTAGIIFAVRMIRKQRTGMDTQLNKLMAEISRFKEKEMEKETVEPSKLPRERVLTESERHFLEEIMATATKLMRTYSVTVEKVADDMCMTPKTLNRKVMDLTGISTKQYLLLTQLEQSRRILVDEHDVPIAEVSLRCGFENSNTFSGAFRRVYGVSPSEFRRKES